MTTPELIQYVKSEVAKGATREVISGKLKMQGWSDLDIIEVFTIMGQVSVPHEEPVIPTQFTQPIQPIQPIQTMNSSLPIQPKSGKKFLKYFIVILALLVLVIGGALAYASGYFLTTSKLFSQMTDSSKNNKTVKFDFSLNVDASLMKVPEGSISLGTDDAKTADFNMTGAFDMTDTTKLKFDSSYIFKMGKIDAGIAVRAIDGALYLNLTKGPDLGFFSLKPFENRWVLIPMTDKEGKLDTTNPLLSVSPVDSSFLNNLTDEQKQHITDIVKKASIIKITKKHLPEMVDGALSYHISFDIDKIGIVSFLTELTDYMKSLDKGNDALVKLEPTDYSKSLDAISSFSGEFWVGIFDKLSHKMIINSTIINPEKPGDGNVKILATLLYKDWNKPVTVEIPSKVVTIEELTKELFGGVSGGTDVNVTSGDTPSVVESKLSQEDYSKKNIMASMRAQAELYYDANKYTYKGYCTSKGEFSAYKLTSTLPNNSNYRCNENDKNGWSAWVEISNGEKYCVDSTGYSGPLKNTEKSITCS
ncbi:MAG: hypothetical protein NTV03_01675 [Candidatus Nomurabacteria bacterium]|nr:hypothetical protein [Candidatus Nomurabacteria bacterium]